MASAAMVAAFPAFPAAIAAEEALFEAPELVGVLTRDDCDALGLMAEVTFVESWSRRLLIQWSTKRCLAPPFPARLLYLR